MLEITRIIKGHFTNDNTIFEGSVQTVDNEGNEVVLQGQFTRDDFRWNGHWEENYLDTIEPTAEECYNHYNTVKSEDWYDQFN